MVKGFVTILMAVAVSLGLVFVCGCESDAQTGAGLGALAGAGIGQLAGGDTESTLIGAAVGGGAGYMVGNERDKKQLREEINTVTVNITNPNGSITPVKLKKQGVGYLGPKGEYYSNLPTSEQLRQAGYGL
ncbi:MAG: glycine zipper domain-containing protein [Planctomycetota bacterium]|jgi:hypothetical protein